jgi:hypothetical protein
MSAPDDRATGRIVEATTCVIAASRWTAKEQRHGLHRPRRPRRPFTGDAAAVEERVDGLIDGLKVYGGTIARTPFGRIGLIFTVPANSLQQATSTAMAVATAPGHPEPLALEVMPTREFRRRVEEGLELTPTDGRTY